MLHDLLYSETHKDKKVIISYEFHDPGFYTIPFTKKVFPQVMNGIWGEVCRTVEFDPWMHAKEFFLGDIDGNEALSMLEILISPR